MNKSIYLFTNDLKLSHVFSSEEGNNTCYDTEYTSDLATGAETFNMSVPVEDTYANTLVDGSFLGFYWSGKFKLMQIKKCKDVEQIVGTHRIVQSEFVGINLLNSYVRPFNMTANITTLLNFLLIGSNYKVGYVSPQVDSIISYVDISETTSIYTVLQNVIEDYGGCEWEIGVNPINQVRGEFQFVINCYANGERGNKTYKRFEHDFNTYGTDRESDITQYCSGLIGVGGNGVTFKDCEWFIEDGDPMDKPLGDDFLLDPQAHERLNNGGSPILSVYKSDATNGIDLLWETYRKLQELNQVKYSYNVPIFMTDVEYEQIDIGDTGYVINDKFNPPIQLEGRITWFSISFTDSSVNTCTLSNFKEVKSKIKNIDRNSIIKDTIDEITGFNGKLTQADIDEIERYLESLDMNSDEIDKSLKELEDNINPGLDVPIVDVPDDVEDMSKIYVGTTDGGLWIGGSRVHDIVKYGVGGTTTTTSSTSSIEYNNAVEYYKKFSLGTKANTSAMNTMTSNTNKYKLSTIVNYWSSKFGLDPYLVFALIMAESSANPYASGMAYGLMQCEKSAYFGRVQTLKFLDGTTKTFTPSLTTMKPGGGTTTLNGVTVDKGISNQIMFGCHKLRESLVRFKYNIFISLVGYNFGLYGADWVVCKYVADKNNLTFKNSRGYTYQSSKVQELYFKELETLQANWSNLRKTYVSTFKAGTATNIEYYLRWYKSVNGQLPYVIDDKGVRRGYGAITPTSTPSISSDGGNNTTITNGVATSLRNIIVNKAKEIVSLHVDQKIATYDQKNRIVNDNKRFKAKGTIYGIKNPYCYDCSSLVSCAYLEAGFNSVYAKSCALGSLVAGATAESGYSMWLCDTEGIAKAIPGDILMNGKTKVKSSDLTSSNMSKYGKTSHTLIYIGDGKVAHASKWAYHPIAIKISGVDYYRKLGTAFFLRPWDLAKADKEASLTTTGTTSNPTVPTIVGSYDSTFKGVPGMTVNDILVDGNLVPNITVNDITNKFEYPKSVNYVYIDFDLGNYSSESIQNIINLVEILKVKYPKVPIFIAKQLKVNSNYGDYTNTNILIDNYNSQLLSYANITQYVIQLDISKGLVTNDMISTTLSTNGYSFKDGESTTKYYDNVKSCILNKPVAMTPPKPPTNNVVLTMISPNTYKYTTPLSSMTFKLPTVVPKEYWSQLEFTTNKDTEPTKVTQSNIVYLSGTDCKNGVLIPKADTTYRITIFNATDTELTTKKYYGYVNGVSNGGQYKDFSTFKGADDLVSIAKSYYTNRSKFVYNNTTPADYTNPSTNTSKWITSGKYHIDDSTFLNYCMMGLNFDNSPYGNNSKTSNKKNSQYSWAMSSVRKEGNIAKYFIENGWAFYQADTNNFSNVKKGDVLFMDSPGWTDNTDFMGVNHIAIVTGEVDGVMKCLDCSNTTGIINYNNLSTYADKNILFIGRIRKD